MAKPIEKRQKEIEKIQKDKDKEIEKVQKDKDVEKSIKDTKIEQPEKGSAKEKELEGAPEEAQAAAAPFDQLAGQKPIKELIKEQGKDIKDRIEKGPLPPEGKGNDPFKEFRDKIGDKSSFEFQPLEALTTGGASVEDRLARLEAVMAEPKPIEKRQKDKEIEKIQKDKDIEKIIKDSDKLRIEKVNIKAEHEKLVKEKPEKVNIKAEHEKLVKEKPEKIEWKEWKHEKFEKIESKELFEKDWFEGKLTDVPPGGFEGRVPQAEAAPPEPEGTVEERLARLEAAVFKMSHFIGIDLRPDLSAGALKQEPDAGGAPEPPQKESAAAPKRRRRVRKGQGSE